jgi:hypothetical protein
VAPLLYRVSQLNEGARYGAPVPSAQGMQGGGGMTHDLWVEIVALVVASLSLALAVYNFVNTLKEREAWRKENDEVKK